MIKHLIPTSTATAFGPIAARYQHFEDAKMQVVDSAKLTHDDVAALCDAPDLLVCWDHEPIERAPAKRTARIAAVYAERWPPKPALWWHEAFWQGFVQRLHKVDAILVHTPWMAEQLAAATGKPTFVLPVGYSAEQQGKPDYAQPRKHKIAYWGAPVGRREHLIPAISAVLGADFIDLTGQAYASILAAANAAEINLNICHSRAESFSTWRIWEAVATSAVLVSEDGDAWPMERRQHYVPLPHVTDIAVLRDMLIRLTAEQCCSIAKRLHADLAVRFSTEACIRDYLLPIYEAMKCI